MNKQSEYAGHMEYDSLTVLLKGNFPFWEMLTEGDRELLRASAAVRRCKKGENLHSAENDCVGVILVLRGTLRTYMLSDEGRDITLYRLHANDSCVLSASCVLSSITFDVFIDAEEDTDLVVISSQVFSDMAERNIYVECYLHKMTTARFSDVMWAMQKILFMSLDRRLAVFLNDELARTGSASISMTHEQIARHTGSSREVITRMLKYFSNEGIVELSRGGITVTDKKKLKSLAL